MMAERGAAWLAHQSGGLGVAGSNPAAPTNDFIHQHLVSRESLRGAAALNGTAPQPTCCGLTARKRRATEPTTFTTPSKPI